MSLTCLGRGVRIARFVPKGMLAPFPGTPIHELTEAKCLQLLNHNQSRLIPFTLTRSITRSTRKTTVCERSAREVRHARAPFSRGRVSHQQPREVHLPGRPDGRTQLEGR